MKHSFAAITNYRKAVALVLAGLLIAAIAFTILKFPKLLPSALFFMTSIFLVALLWQFPKWQVRSISGLDNKDRFDSENEARKTLSQILGGVVLLVGFYFTWQNMEIAKENQARSDEATRETLRIASEGQITERFTKAITQLGDTKLEVRLGGIYALERIAKDSPKDHWPIMEVLTAYVREHAKLLDTQQEALAQAEKNLDRRKTKLAPDIQAILTVITRRAPAYKKGEEQRLDLRGVNLALADLSGADLSGADLTDTNLSKADLSGTTLNEAFLLRTILFDADISNAKVIETHLEQAILTKANLKGTDLRGSNFGDAGFPGGGAKLLETDLSGEDLSDAQGLSAAQLESARGDAKTKLPNGIPRPKSWH